MAVMLSMTDSFDGFSSNDTRFNPIHLYNPDSCTRNIRSSSAGTLVAVEKHETNYDQEASMTICMEGPVARLQGDLTHSGVTKSIINSLAVCLLKIESGVEKTIRIDCGRVLSADISGLQLLYVWIQCARFRGVETKLINLSVSLEQTLANMGLGHCFTGINVCSETPFLKRA